MKAVVPIVLGIMAVLVISGCATQEQNEDNMTEEFYDMYESYRALLVEYSELQDNYTKLNGSCSGLLEDWNRWIGNGSRINTSYGLFNMPEGTSYTRLACTGSMEPTLKCGDLPLMYPVDSPNDIRVGDIITYNIPPTRSYPDSDFMIHRVVQIVYTDNGVHYRTKGDDSDIDPELIPFENVTGKIIGVIYKAE